MNPTIQAIQKRFSCRSFTGKMPPAEHIQAIARAAIQSPSSMNRQRWQILVVRNAPLLEEMQAQGMAQMAHMPDQTLYERIMERGGKLFYDAPCMMLVAIEPSDAAGAALDCGIVCENIAIAAQSLGLASCICGLARFAFDGEKAAYFKEKLQFPPGYEFGMAVLLGTATESGNPHQPDVTKITYID